MKRINVSLLLLSALFVAILPLHLAFKQKETLTVSHVAKNKQSCIGTKLNDLWLSDPFDAKAKTVVDIKDSGKLTITDAPNNGLGPFTPVSFKVYIKKSEVFNAIPVPDYANKSLLEVDLEAVLKHCKIGDQIILEITEKGKYGPDFQEITVGGGDC